MDKKVFGEQLRRYRERIGYTQEVLAEQVHCTTIFISYMERGEKAPGLDTLIKLANVLNIPTDLLLGKEVKSFTSTRMVDLESCLRALPEPKQHKMMEMFEAILAVELKEKEEEE